MLSNNFSIFAIRKVGLFAAFAFMLGSSQNLCADNIDVELIRKAPQIIEKLREHNYQNIGVLPFRVKMGQSRPSFEVGLINENMAERLRNAVILAMNPEMPPIGIARNVSEIAAAKISNGSYRTVEDREKLFEVEYPLTWGNKSVKVDAFLAGKISISPDFRITSVQIELFDRETTEKVIPILRLEVDTDRYILADAGQGFSASKGRKVFSRGPSDDDIIVGISEGATSEEEDESEKDEKSNDSIEFPVEFKLFYDGKEVPLSQDESRPGKFNFKTKDPKKGQVVTFGVKNVTSKPLGMVMTVNGISTLYESTGQADRMPKWVLQPGVQYSIKGYHQEDGSNYVEIVGISDEVSELKFADFGGPERAGMIHLYVFREVDVQLASAPQFSRSLKTTKTITTDATAAYPKTLQEQQALITKGFQMPPRGLMAWGPNEQQEKLVPQSIDETALTDTMIIRYYMPEDLPEKEKPAPNSSAKPASVETE